MNKLAVKHPSKRAFITGGASGIGQALAYRFAREGWKVAIADINLERLAETAKQVKALGGEPLSLELNVASEGDWLSARDQVNAQWGGIDLLFNNAGIAGGGAFDEMPLSEWQRNTDINYWGVIYGIRAFLPAMKVQSSGHILNTASCAGIFCAGDMAPYNATKAAVISISETLHKELREFNIASSVILPTVVKTNIGENKNKEMDDSPSAGQLLGQIEKSSFTADDAASAIFKGLHRSNLYIFTRYDGVWMSFVKRFMPQGFSNLLGWMVINKVGIFK